MRKVSNTSNWLQRGVRPLGLAPWLFALAVAAVGCGDGASDLAGTGALPLADAVADAGLGDSPLGDAPQSDEATADATGDLAPDTNAADGPPPADAASEVALAGCQTDTDCPDDDQNLCTGVPYCDLAGPAGVCKPNYKTVVECPAASGPCLTNACEPATGKCVAAPADNAKCDDGNPCTANDSCSSGKCVGGEPICKCLGDSDCAGLGNLCTGQFYCDKGSFPFVCVLNPATVVTCPTGLDTECAKHVCNPASGQCDVNLAADGTPCDDGNGCSANDFCVGGECTAGQSVCACTSNADCAAHEDGNLCNGTLFCDLSLSKPACAINPATVVSCSDGNDTECAHNQCDPASGKCAMVPMANTAKCSDGNQCTAGDHCQDGKCAGGANTCKCITEADCAPHEDGNLCNGTLFCNKAAAPFVCDINPASVVSCSKGNDTACSKAACQPTTGKCAMIALADTTLCDADDFACTQGDACLSGVCVPGTNICSCVAGPDCNKYEDGNLCNGTLYCDKSASNFVCKVNPATLVVCKTVDDTACLANRCEKTSGKCALTPIRQGDTCEADGNLCTAGDSCNQGACEVGPNTCQCTADADCAAYDDGNLCNGTLFCDKSKLPFVCAANPASVVTCPTSGDTPCAKSTCQPKTGQCSIANVADGSACSDGDICTLDDTCAGGSCAGTPVCACKSDADCGAFDDGNLCNGGMVCDTQALPHVCKPDYKAVVCPVPASPCQQSSCNPATGLCVASADLSHDGTPCDDQDACSTASSCSSGACQGTAGVVCSDGKACTADSCSAGGCVFLPLAGTLCDDSDACTSGDKCTNLGTCAGSAISCDDGNVCTDDSCDSQKGCLFVNNAAPCSDAKPCTAQDTCQAGTCAGTAKNCSDGNPCTVDSCAALSGACVFAPVDATSCDDGNACTAGDACSQGSCQGSPKVCDDGKPCTIDSCGPTGGCSNVPASNGAPCEDGSPCTQGDSCTQGVCTPGPSCDDGNPCTDDSCGGGKCVHIVANGKACDDGNACTTAELCIKGTCQGSAITCSACSTGGSATCDPKVGCAAGSLVCDDGNPCTADACVKTVGCVADPLSGTPCGSTNASTCSAGLCANCGSFQAFIKVAGSNFQLAGFSPRPGGGYLAVGRLAKTGSSKGNAVLAVVTSSGTLDKYVETGDSEDDGFAAVRAVGLQYYAVGWATDPKGNQPRNGLVQRFSANGDAFAATMPGLGGDEALYALTADGAGVAVAAGTQQGKGWVVKLDLLGGVSKSTQQTAPIAGTLAWQGITVTDTGDSFLAVGTCTTATGSRAVVALLDANLATKWIVTPGAGPADQLLGIARQGATYVAVGSAIANGVGTPWTMSLTVASGGAMPVYTEPSTGLKGYAAAAFGTDGSLAAVGGADIAGSQAKLPPYGWFARWQAETLKVARTVAAGKSGELTSVIAQGDHWLAGGTTVLATGPEQCGWLVELGSNGTPACLAQ